MRRPEATEDLETREGIGRRPGKIGAWSGKGEFLGEVSRLGERPGGGRGASGARAYCSVSRGSDEGRLTFTLHPFPGGYRVHVEEWGKEEDEHRALWLAPVDEEEESYIGLFSEEEARWTFPYLFAALEMPGGVRVG